MTQMCTHGHDHHHAANERRTFIAACLITTFMLVEVVGGLWTGSLALLADAGHMVTDAASLFFAWVAFRVARRPASSVHTYGWSRMQVLAGYTNGIALLFLVGWIAVEAVMRLFHPAPVMGLPMMAVAAMGLLVNIVVFFVLHGAEKDNPNIRGALLHVLGDLLGSVAALLAAGLILAFGWMWADPVLSLLVSVLLLKSCWFLIRQTAHVLLEGTPAGIDITALRRDLPEHVHDIVEVHHVHAWEVSHNHIAVTLHACLTPGAGLDAARLAIHAYLLQTYGISHITVQLEEKHCDEKECA